MTHIIDIHAPNLLSIVLPAFERGELVVLPTETVYGVACRFTDEAAIQKIYEAKNRPPSKAMQIMLSDIEFADKVATGFPEAARKLANAFMPGAITITLPKRDDLLAVISPYPTVGIRIPDYDPLRQIIRALGGIIAITSANRSGESSPLNVQMALDALGKSVAVYVDGGAVRGGLSSTVVETTLGNEIKILREGPISREQIDTVLAR